jgi:hypothetical protein
MDSLKTFLAKVSAALEGEPLRAITYGALVVVWLVTHIAVAAGSTAFVAVDLNAALIAVTAATVALSEIVRQFVTPVAAPVLPIGQPVTTPSGSAATVAAGTPTTP